MDSWSTIQLKKMQAGGNSNLNGFLQVCPDAYKPDNFTPFRTLIAEPAGLITMLRMFLRRQRASPKIQIQK
ncbi:hypothetical protein N9P82_01220 [bacterium]|jgi:hypothetical protein|nr:hypothetical protein [bacterium]